MERNPHIVLTVICSCKFCNGFDGASFKKQVIIYNLLMLRYTQNRKYMQYIFIVHNGLGSNVIMMVFYFEH